MDWKIQSPKPPSGGPGFLIYNSVSRETVRVGEIPQGSNKAFSLRFTQAERIPAEMAPMTSKGLLEMSQASEALASAHRIKCA